MEYFSCQSYENSIHINNRRCAVNYPLNIECVIAYSNYSTLRTFVAASNSSHFINPSPTNTPHPLHFGNIVLAATVHTKPHQQVHAGAATSKMLKMEKKAKLIIMCGIVEL